MSVIKKAIVSQGSGPLNPSYFCVHSTANPGATAANHVTYWSRNPTIPMAHLVSDWTEAYHTVPYDRLVAHVGNGNSLCEGLEICEATNETDFQRGIQIAAQVVRERLAARGWDTGRLICHDEACRMWGGTDHTDPIPYFTKWGYSWDQFKQLVQGGTDMAITTDEAKQIAAEVWSYQYDPNQPNMYNAVQYEMGGKIWGYDYKKSAPGGNVYNTLVYETQGQLKELKTMVTAQTAAIEALSKSMGADPQQIAKAVQDAVKAKLDALEITVTATDGD
ncbi:N-acetylmuramoyl-L-alanine amidase [Bifidobacterium lemurum]|uniref:N-acetylmuramoyl-L-alanine amidase n=1 Tax=Bifidobacterium lemurum TaxID=1603886 RepID=A0A261FUS2_9BIFI|nr:N-acetylmuramoyl-L-alanine amidase [Bifidobacterium lemurum]OZG62695.1 N-acetylmuramoyl-L-alanine amidase [Bifidobacterium lemurum]QOL34588.1 N-acetylmuramoyl-L-alanine amidase [Bifidobacterium lemurum]